MIRSQFLFSTAAAGLLVGTLSSFLPGLNPASSNADAPAAISREAKSPPAGLSDPNETMGVALAAFSGSADLLDLARLGEVLEHLDSAQIARLLDRLELHTSAQEDRSLWLYRWWLKRDPRAAGAWILHRMDPRAQNRGMGSFFDESSTANMIGAWVEANPREALEFARLHRRFTLRSKLLVSAMDAWPAKDFESRFRVLLDFPSGSARRDGETHLLRAWAKAAPETALANASALPAGFERRAALASVLFAWPEEDACGALLKYQELGLSDPEFLESLVVRASRKNPAKTAEILGQLGAGSVARGGRKVAAEWAGQDPAAALAWAMAYSVDLSNSPDDTGPLQRALSGAPDATVAWIRGLPPGPDRDWVSGLASGMRGLSLDQSLQLFSTLSPDAAAHFAGTLASRFAEDPLRGQQWAASLPAGPAREQAWVGLGALEMSTQLPPVGPDRDGFVSGKASSYFDGEPDEALDAAAQISDPVLQRAVLDKAVEYVASQWPDKLQRWLDRAAVPEEWKTAWRAALPRP